MMIGANSIEAMLPELCAWRRDLHQHPELGYEERRSARLIAERLRAFGFDAVETQIGGTGVVGVLHGASGPAQSEQEAILLRADMDALPMTEEADVAHRSTAQGKMHACGHDGHMTMLLGAAKLLAQTRAFKGTLYFCFQPAEEGGAGAHAMIKDGLFERFPCRAVFGMHNWPGLPVGAFAIRSGPMLAAADTFSITLQGRGGHAAKPDRARDPIVAGAQLVSALQTLVSRSVDPLDEAVLSVTMFHAGEAHNVIPDKAHIGGTVRSFNEDVHQEIHTGLRRLAEGVAAAFDMKAQVERPSTFYPPTINEVAQTNLAHEAALEAAGMKNVSYGGRPTMGAEDFAFLARERPGAFIFCGNGDSAPLHNAWYDFNDDAIAHGVRYWATLAQKALPV